jgi:hypothetical protein
MVFKGSRYSASDVIEVRGPDDRVRRTLATRVIAPPPSALEQTAVEGERIDTLAQRFYGEPTKYWLLLDGNPDTLNPFELLAPGATIHVPKNRLVGP